MLRALRALLAPPGPAPCDCRIDLVPFVENVDAWGRTRENCYRAVIVRGEGK